MSLRVARNMCVEHPENQHIVWAELSAHLITYISDAKRAGSVRALALQVLTNTCAGQPTVQAQAWALLFPAHMCAWLQEADDVAVMAAALTSTCLATDRERRTSLLHSTSGANLLCALLALAERESVSASQLVWAATPFVRLLNDSELPLLCGALPSAAHRAQLFRLAAALLESGEVQAERVMSEACADWLLHFMAGAQHGELLATQLQLLAELAAVLAPPRLYLTRHGLVAFLLSLLRLLAPPDPHARPADAPSPAGALRQEVLRVLANVLYDNAEAKDALGREGMLTLLSQATLDPGAPHAREWALFAVRNAVAEHAANSALVASLRQDTVLASPALADAGLRAVVRDGKLRLEPAPPGQ